MSISWLLDNVKHLSMFSLVFTLKKNFAYAEAKREKRNYTQTQIVWSIQMVDQNLKQK